MGKKRVEEEFIESAADTQQFVEQSSRDDGLVNPLRNERIIVRYILRPSTMVPNKNHVLYGGMAETAIRRFTVPRLSNGSFKNVLTNSENSSSEA